MQILKKMRYAREELVDFNKRSVKIKSKLKASFAAKGVEVKVSVNEIRLNKSDSKTP